MIAPKEVYKDIIENLIPLHRYLGFELLEVSDGFARIKVPFKEELIGNPRIRALHGGIISTAMDSVGGAAAMTTLVSSDDRLSTIDIRVDYLRPGNAKDLIVEGNIVRSGNRIVVTSMKAYHAGSEKIIAVGKGVYNVNRKQDQ